MVCKTIKSGKQCSAVHAVEINIAPKLVNITAVNTNFYHITIIAGFRHGCFWRCVYGKHASLTGDSWGKGMWPVMGYFCLHREGRAAKSLVINPHFWPKGKQQGVAFNFIINDGKKCCDKRVVRPV